MNEKIKELDAALQLLSLLCVSGDAVDALAAAKSKIRRVQAEIKEGSGKE